MQRDRCYDDLIRALLLETRQSQPAVSVRFESFRELHDTLLPVDSGHLFFVSAEPQEPRDCPCGRQSCIDHIVSMEDEVQELDLSKLLGHLNEYFSWFGTVQVIYLLGTSVAVFKMEHTFSVSHVLKCSLHEISIPRENQSLPGSAHGPPSILDSLPGPNVSALFTVHAFHSDSLSLNAILSILKYVDRKTVVMVRRVNRLGFGGSGIVRKYLERYGKVLKVFMLPLRSRKKNLVLPSKTGFVVMDSIPACSYILSTPEHTVAPGMTVSVGPFTHRGLVLNT